MLIFIFSYLEMLSVKIPHCLFKKIFLLMYSFFAVRGLRCCGLSLVAVSKRGAQASRCSGLSRCGAWALKHRLQQLWHMRLAAPRYTGSFQTRDWTRVSCFAGRLFTIEPPEKSSWLSFQPQSLAQVNRNANMITMVCQASLLRMFSHPILRLGIQTVLMGWENNRSVKTRLLHCCPVYREVGGNGQRYAYSSQGASLYSDVPLIGR